jgi:hypothetical protein
VSRRVRAGAFPDAPLIRPVVATIEVDARELRFAGAVMLGAGALLPLLPDGAGVPCPLRTLTGIPCPLCGMTTSVVATVHLRLDEALAANPAGVAAVAVAVALLALRPERLRIRAPLVLVALVAMWIFELHRFSLV